MENREETRVIDILEYWNVILKRKWIVLCFAGTLILITGVYSFLETPLYRAGVTILLEEGSSRMLSIEDSFGAQGPIIQDLRSYNTQINMLKSRSLAERVARKMNLPARPG